MPSKPDSPQYDPIREAEMLLAIARELHRLTEEATERARAAFARINQPLPLFPTLDDREGR